MCDGSSPAVDRSDVLSRICLILARLSKSSAAFPRRLINSRYLANDSRSSEDVGPNEVAPVEFVLLAALAPRADQWFVMVEGRSTVGKSRTLFEAIHRYDAEQDHLHLVAPRDAAALRDLLDPTKGVLRFGGPAVLWLDDVESSSIPV
jgi:hypothetical protein